MSQFSSAIIGLGRIGQGYDYDCSDDSLILTHATAFTYHTGYQLVGAVDPDKTQRERFERKFGRPAYPDLQALMVHHQPDVFSIVVSTVDHFQVFQEIMRSRPRAVLCEKPIATCVEDARRMLSLAEENRCALLVNYGRRYEPGILALRRALDNGSIGKVYKGTVWYSKGLLNNGSHFVDLLRFLLGEVTAIHIVERGREWYGNDPEPDVCFRFGEALVYFLACREECFSIGHMALVGTRGLVRYGEGGGAIEIQEREPDRVYSGYNTLSQEKQTIPIDFKRSQWHVVEALYRHLTHNAPLNSDGKSAMETLAVIENASELLHTRPL